MVTLTTVNWMHEADFLCAHLASCGIDAIVPDQNTATVLPLHAGAIGGIRIQVKEADLEQARDVLRDIATVPGEEPIKCPACQSVEVNYHRVSWPFFAVVVVLFGVPLLWLSKKFTCQSCGHHWNESKSTE